MIPLNAEAEIDFMNPEQTVKAKYELAQTRWADRGIQVMYSQMGQMAKEQANEIAFEIEGVLKDQGVKKGVVKRVFSTLIEALQNIRIHGERDDDGNQWCYILIGHDPDNERFIIRTANLAFAELQSTISGKIDKVNAFEPDALKAHYMEILSNGQLSSKGGAGLGFITIAMKSKNKIDYSFDELGEGLELFSMDAYVTTAKKES